MVAKGSTDYQQEVCVWKGEQVNLPDDEGYWHPCPNCYLALQWEEGEGLNLEKMDH